MTTIEKFIEISCNGLMQPKTLKDGSTRMSAVCEEFKDGFTEGTYLTISFLIETAKERLKPESFESFYDMINDLELERKSK